MLAPSSSPARPHVSEVNSAWAAGSQVKARPGLTICTVSFGSRRMIQRNQALIASLNPGTKLEWVVVENATGELAEQRGLELYEQGPEGTRVVAGAAPLPPDYKGGASIHHGAGLNLALQSVQTQHALLLDPDFFLVLPNLLQAMLDRMQAKELALLGVPWHPRWYRKWRGFPCAHALMLDMHRLSRSRLDFRADPKRQAWPYLSPYLTDRRYRWASGHPWRTVLRCLRDAPHTLHEWMLERQGIGSSRDTGYRVYLEYGRRQLVRTECVLPSYRSDEDRLHPPQGVWVHGQPSRLSLTLDWAFPPPWRYRPMPWQYTKRRFVDLGLPDVRARGWEEFFWQGQPFGFHLRSGLRGHRPSADGEDPVPSILAEVESWVKR